MLEMFGPTQRAIQDSHVHHAINYVALVMLLVENGVITEEELDRMRPKATNIVDQLLAKQKAEVEAEFDKEYPGVRDLFKDVMGGA